MALPSPSSPVNYIFNRQYKDKYLLSKSLLRERLGHARNLYRKDLLAHYGCVNAIEFSNEGELLVSGGDDRRVLLWKVEEAIHGVGKPVAMRAQHISNIFCLGYDSTNSKIFSAGNDDQVIVHDTRTGDPIDFFLHEQPVYGLSVDPLNDNVFASACDDGRVLIFDIREPASTEPFCLAGYTSAFHAVMFNPVEPRLLTTANSKEGVGLWDIRKPRQVVLRYGCNGPPQSCMSARFNSRGTHVLALRRRLPPVLYAVHSPAHVCQFDHQGYYNSCTMKSCCFAGESDDYVLSGSDDFNLYVWKIPTDLGVDGKAHWIIKAHMVLKGHRSIVNQVRFNYTNYLIASSGVEKLIKFWSPFPLPGSSGGLAKEAESCEKQRKVYTHEEYISLVLRSGQFMSHDYSNQSTREDPRMMAFFDSLVQREIEGWGSGSEGSSVEDGAVRGWEGRRWVPQAAVATQTTDDGTSETSPSSPLQAPPPAADVSHSAELTSLSSPETSSPSPSLTSASSSTSDSSSTSSSSSSSSSACIESDSDSGESSKSEQVLESWSREEGSGTPNRISQLIAQKRAQLVRLARVKHRRQSPHQPKWRPNSSGQGASTQTSLVSIARILFPSEDANSSVVDEPVEEGRDWLRDSARSENPSGTQRRRAESGSVKTGRQAPRSKGTSKVSTETSPSDAPSVSGLQKEASTKSTRGGTSKLVLDIDKSPPAGGTKVRRKRPNRARRIGVGNKRKVDSSGNDTSDDGDSSDILPLKKRVKGAVKCGNAQPDGDDGVRDKASVIQSVLTVSQKRNSERNGSVSKSDKKTVTNSKVSGYSSSTSGCTSEEGEDLDGKKSGPSRKGKRPVKLCKVLLRLNHNCEKVTNGNSVNGQGSSSTPSSVNGKVCNTDQESLPVSPVSMRHALETPDSGISSGQCRESAGTTNGSTTNGNAGQLTEGSSGSTCVFKRLNRRSGKAPYRNYRSKVGYDSDSN
ncbi:DDB1- and CUL4-associated factor 5 isoform X2 [Ischnura elegans]|uniref:DDB1- and CUL4-associated factor 5 isoform X2 n=1 Tax=Ischnura elegans TaxID=197161 RepID=UPI001ED8A6AE|nr:DDB1- and CUL4-associated factor 5 isoform X2 [Ischnura elegans]